MSAAEASAAAAGRLPPAGIRDLRPVLARSAPLVWCESVSQPRHGSPTGGTPR